MNPPAVLSLYERAVAAREALEKATERMNKIWTRLERMIGHRFLVAYGTLSTARVLVENDDYLEFDRLPDGRFGLCVVRANSQRTPILAASRGRRAAALDAIPRLWAKLEENESK